MSHRIYCTRCKSREMEHIPFLSQPWSRMTKSLERTILELRQHMSIRAISNYFRLRWHTISDNHSGFAIRSSNSCRRRERCFSSFRSINKLKRSKLKIVTMDMANAYYSWINQEFPNVKIVFDYFHVIKLMNDKLDNVRRRVAVKLNIIQQKLLKGLRFIFLKNNENLPEDAKIILRNMRGEFQELGDAYMFKEALRVIY